MHALVRGGADVIELGVPFSDPMADGEVIQRASERALAHGTSLDDVLSCVAGFRATDHHTPVVLMGYLNPYEHMGPARFAPATAGVDGAGGRPAAGGGDRVQPGVARCWTRPDISSRRTRPMVVSRQYAQPPGFVYLLRQGRHGRKTAVLDEIALRIDFTRRHAGIPVGIGFGIRTPEHAAAAAAVADAVIVGSAIVERVEQGAGNPGLTTEVEQLARTLRVAVDSVAAAERGV